MPTTVPPTRKIPINALVRDIKDGVTDSEIMEKYKLSSEGLKSALRKLLDADAISPFLLTEWSQLFGDSTAMADIRLFKRCALDFYLPVYDAKDRRGKGRVINVSDSGIALSGIPATVDEYKMLAIPIKSNRLVLWTKCRWFKKQDPTGADVGGFEVLKVLKGNWEDFFQKIRARMGAGADEKQPIQAAEQRRPQQPGRPMDAVPPQVPPVEKHGVLATDQQEGIVEEQPPVQQEAVQSDEPSLPPIEPTRLEVSASAEGPSLAFVQSCIESDEFITLFTTSRQVLAFIINPMSFAEMVPETRLEMLDQVKTRGSVMIADLRKKATAFQLAIENSALLAETRP